MKNHTKRLAFPLGSGVILGFGNDTLDAFFYQEPLASAKPLIQTNGVEFSNLQAGEVRSVSSTLLTVSQSGSSVVAGAKKDVAVGVVTEACDANAIASKPPPLHTAPLSKGAGGSSRLGSVRGYNHFSGGGHSPFGNGGIGGVWVIF